MSRSCLVLAQFILLLGAPRALGQANAVYILDSTTASPGATVRVPFSIFANREVTAFGYSIDFDEEVLQAIGWEPVFQRPDGQPWDSSNFEVNNENRYPGNAGVDEGWFYGHGLFSWGFPMPMAANTETEVAAFYFRVRAETTAAVTQIRFVDGAGGPYFGNSVEARWLEGDPGRIDATTEPASVLVGATLNISREVFRRGDVNADDALDLSDAVTTLEYLFGGEEIVACEDAADANDDGTVDISDPVAELGYLFLGSSPLPPPFGACGADPTEDSLACASYTACP
jgi:hypothetical protein